MHVGNTPPERSGWGKAAKNGDLHEFACHLPPTPSRARYCFHTVGEPYSVSNHIKKGVTRLPGAYLFNSTEIFLVDEEVPSGGRGVSLRHLWSKEGQRRFGDFCSREGAVAV